MFRRAPGRSGRAPAHRPSAPRAGRTPEPGTGRLATRPTAPGRRACAGGGRADAVPVPASKTFHRSTRSAKILAPPGSTARPDRTAHHARLRPSRRKGHLDGVPGRRGTARGRLRGAAHAAGLLPRDLLLVHPLSARGAARADDPAALGPAGGDVAGVRDPRHRGRRADRAHRPAAGQPGIATRRADPAGRQRSGDVRPRADAGLARALPRADGGVRARALARPPTPRCRSSGRSARRRCVSSAT